MTESSEPNIAGLLLAAGGSSRLGRPKQLVEFEGKTLIRRAAEALIEAECSPVVVVLGAELNGSRRELDGLAVEIVENKDWPSGMSSSIRLGTEAATNIDPLLDAVIITACDQPLLAGEHLRKFVKRFTIARASIIAAEYNGVRGIPALLSRDLFLQLRNLTGDKGARELIRTSPDAIAIPLPEAAIDIDSVTDIGRLDPASD